MTPEKRAELRTRMHWIVKANAGDIDPTTVIALLDALDEADLAYRGQAAATRALLDDRDAEIVRLREADPRRAMIAAHVAASLAKIFGGDQAKELAEAVAESAVLIADAVVAELQKGEQ